MLLDKNIPLWYIASKIKREAVYVLVIGIVVYYLTHFFKHLLPQMPLTIPAFIGTAISILLSFKLNQSYDRWWEARKIWGSIVNDSRTLVLQLQSILGPGQSQEVNRFARRQVAWCYALGNSLRGLDPLAKTTQLIPPDELQEVKQHTNKPLALLQLHSRQLGQLKADNQLELFAFIQLDNTIVRLCDSMGRAERIKSTVFPVTYRLFLHFIIYLFTITLSIALHDIESYYEIPLLLVISSAFFLLERSATHMQDPFNNLPTDTAVDAIARTIEINIRQLIGDKEIPPPHQPNKFYLT